MGQTAPAGSAPVVPINPVGPGAPPPTHSRPSRRQPAERTAAYLRHRATLQFTAVASDSSSKAIAKALFSWAVNDTTLATINQTTGAVQPTGKRGSLTVIGHDDR